MKPPRFENLPVTKQAEKLAEWLRADPILAGQLREHFRPEELIQLLGLESEVIVIQHNA